MNPYFEQTILNADSLDLVGIMYQRTIAWVVDARGHLSHKRIAQRSEAIMRAYAVLAELLAALRPEMAPELAGRLQSLYLYIQQRLLDANMQQADAPLAEVLKLLVTLEGAWLGVKAELKTTKDVSGGMEEVPREADAGQWRRGEAGSEFTSRHAVSA